MNTFQQIQSIEVVVSDETAIQELGKLSCHLVVMYRDFRSKGENELSAYQKTIAAYERIKKAVGEKKQ